MNEQIKALIERNAKELAQYRSDLEAAEKQYSGVLPADVRETFQKRELELDNLKETIDLKIRQDDRESRSKQSLPSNTSVTEIVPAGAEGSEQEKKNKALMMDLRSFLQTNVPSQELRALSQGVKTEGGYLVTPIEFLNELLKDIDKKTYVRELVRTFQISGTASLGVPVLDADPADAEWTTELATGSLDTAMSFGKRELAPNPAAKRVKVSKSLIRNAFMSVDAIVRERLAYKFAITLEKAFLTGNGASKPLGVMTASNNGIPTSRDVSTGNQATAVTVDGLINAIESLEDAYQINASWIYHRDTVAMIRKLKDGNGQYLLQPRISDSVPETILGKPYRRSEFMPNTFTTGQYVGIIGDFQYYWLVESMQMQIQVLLELYAEANQNGYIGRMEGDGMPVLGKAFARVKLG